MKYNELEVGAKKTRKRVGRGISAGGGKTAGRGTKGQRSRTGKKLGPVVSFQGGSASIIRTAPKLKGFKSKRVPAQVVYSEQLNDVKGAKVDNFALFEAGLINTPHHAVKVIARGELTSKAKVEVAGMSASVAEQLKKNGGEFVKTPVPLPKSTKVKEDKPEKGEKPAAKAKSAK
ncbi:50S ribosomal protein L15 [Candidatus Saccharibacteria bacterium]|nr:50S ribosomal protein L15 [Candidatus Saccharibacteria bacterium]